MLCSVKNLGLPMVKALGKWFTGYTFRGNVLVYFKMLYNAVAPLAKMLLLTPSKLKLIDCLCML